MNKIKASGFGVRFYRRGVQKVAVPQKNTVQDNVQKAGVMNVPSQAFTYHVPSLKRVIARKKLLMVFAKSAMPGFPFRIFDGVTHCLARGVLMRISGGFVVPEIISVPVPQSERRMIGANEQMLWAAAYRGDCRMIRMLVMEGVDLEARDEDGRTAINIATQYGRQEALKTLLSAKEMRYLASLGKLPDTNFYRKFHKQKTGT